MKLLEDGGVLFSSSCSHFITNALFENMLKDAAKEAGKIMQVLEVRSQAEDHPRLLCHDESGYLKFYILKDVSV